MNGIDLIGVPLVIRIFLVVLFPFSALDKILNWEGALKQANSSFLPGGPVLLVLGMTLELLGPACILSGWHDRLAAFLLGLYCIVTALLYHDFWAYRDFWKQGDSVARTHFWDFLKNFCVAGGMLLLTFGTQLAPLGAVVTHPLSSTPVYTPAGTAPGLAPGDTHE
ncbi:DoxX family protein [Frateuria terrea]|uniref:Putative oxidoreductase n=1 Tax=Frateuria terrea TaxID=529704 RepID=A0A1H6YNW1_9GAMM|nr:DoxX family protein [Frateuria terrea]SEJ42969.1 putative oxidoreductase [Frateuria terrea]SFP72857.1 putative oxidoreductase [Frateuria terrea]